MRIKSGFFFGVLLLAFVASAHAQTCTITATVKTGTNQAASGFPITLVKVIKNGALISQNPLVFRTNSSGVAAIPVACNSSPYFYANAFGLNRNGTAGVMLSVGATDDTLENLASAVTIFSSLNQIIYSSSSLKPLALNPNVGSAVKLLGTRGNGTSSTDIGYWSIAGAVSYDNANRIITITGGGGGGGGSVSTFSAGNLSPLFTSTVSNPTTTPALAFSLNNQSANTLFAGPTTGAAAAPTFRALVAGDVPDLSASYATAGHTHTFASLTSKPTTLSGYGITDAAALSHTHAAADITSGTFALARLSGITTAELSATAGITNGQLAGSIANAKLSNSAITIAGTSTSLGGSIPLDTITGLSTTGLVKRTAANTLGIATSGADYAPATSGATLLAGNGSGGFTGVTGSSTSSGNVSLASGKYVLAQTRDAGGQVYNVQAYGWLPDGTDHSAEALSLLATVYAAGGGTLYFPPSTGTYRADSQLLIPNDSASPQPNQPSIKFEGAGASKQWYGVGASVLDLRYTAANGNAKIETRGKGTLAIVNLTIKDGGSSNTTPLVHTTNTTLLVEGNTFIGSANAGQDAIVLGGTSTTLSGLVAAPFQGYGTAIKNNHFRSLNRGLYGLNYANAVEFAHNSFQGNVGTVAIEFDCSNAGGQTCYGNTVSNNVIEMDVYTYGVKLNLGRENLFSGNQFHDPGGSVTSYYYFTNLSTQNKIIGAAGPSSKPYLTGDTESMYATTIIDSQSGMVDPSGKGAAASRFAYGVVVSGTYNSGNDYAGQLTVASQATPANRVTIGFDDANARAVIDSKIVSGATLALNLSGGAVTTGGALTVGSTANVTTSLTTPKVIWTGNVQDLSGSGSPEGAVTAAVGSVYRRTDGGSGTTVYFKESGTGNTGWTASTAGGMSIGGTVTGATAGRVPYIGSGPVLADSADLTFDNTNKILKAGGALDLSRSASSSHYYNVASLSTNGATGTLKVVLPTAKRYSSTMLSIVIRGYDYSTTGAWQVVLGGYNFSTTPWTNTTATITGPAPFTSVRFADDGTNNLILLGTTSTVWSIGVIEVTDVITTFSNVTGWGSGWSASIIGSETGISGIVTPTTTVPGKLILPLATAVPAISDTTSNSIIVGNTTAANVHARFGQIDATGSSGGYPAYIQAGNYLGGSNYYNLLLENKGGNVGVGNIIAPAAKLHVVSDAINTVPARIDAASGPSVDIMQVTTNGTANLTVNSSGHSVIGGGTTANELRFLEPSGSGTNYTAFKATAQSANITYTLPDTVGAAGTYLKDVAGNGVLSWAAPAGGGDALTTSPLSQFAATTSAQLAGVLSDETGTGAAVFAGSPTFTGTVSAANITATGVLTTSGGRKVTRTASASASFSVAASGELIAFTSTSAVQTATLPDGATAGTGAIYTFVDEGNAATSFNKTISRAGSDTFVDGSTSMILDCSGCSIRVLWTGAAWKIL